MKKKIENLISHVSLFDAVNKGKKRVFTGRRGCSESPMKTFPHSLCKNIKVIDKIF